MIALLTLLGCPGPTTPSAVSTERTACDPLDPAHCAFPFPSRHHLAEDDTTETGFRVNYAEGSLMSTSGAVDITTTYWNEKDGFSINSSLLFHFPGGSDTGLVSFRDIDTSLGPDSTTVLVDLTTGERVPHFVDLDATARDEEGRVYVLHPAVPLEYDRDYAVGVRGLVDGNGSLLTASPGFTSLRDAGAADPDLDYRRARFDDSVFPALDAQGFARADLQLAWEFHTVSEDSSIGRMIRMRDDALASVGEDGPDYVIKSVEDEACEGGNRIARTVEVEVTTPLYVDRDGPGAFLNRDGSGEPLAPSDTTFDVLFRIPCSVWESGTPGQPLQYGHGLLGDRTEVRTGWLSAFADDYALVPFAADWTGMSTVDAVAILGMATGDPGTFALVPERSMQGLVQQMLATKLVAGPMRMDPAFAPNGTSLLAEGSVGYYGNSQGGIMGGALMALSPDLENGVLGVTGSNYGLTLPRSQDFDPYFDLLRSTLSDDKDLTLLVQGLFQQLWDVSEAAGYLHQMVRDPIAGTPAKHILMHVGIGDLQVTTLGAHLQARAYGADLIEPAYRPVWGVEEVAPGFTGSALVEFHYSDAALEPDSNLPPRGGDPHECPRREVGGQAQIATFLATGMVTAACDGVCSSSIAEVCP